MGFNMAFMSLQYGVHDSQPQPHAFLDAAFLAAEIWVEDARKQIVWDTLSVVSYGKAWFGSKQLSIRKDASCVVPGKALWSGRNGRPATPCPPHSIAPVQLLDPLAPLGSRSTCTPHALTLLFPSFINRLVSLCYKLRQNVGQMRKCERGDCL